MPTFICATTSFSGATSSNNFNTKKKYVDRLVSGILKRPKLPDLNARPSSSTNRTRGSLSRIELKGNKTNWNATTMHQYSRRDDFITANHCGLNTSQRC